MIKHALTANTLTGIILKTTQVSDLWYKAFADLKSPPQSEWVKLKRTPMKFANFGFKLIKPKNNKIF